jgi:DNA-binding transcriptional LysR family regulator
MANTHPLANHDSLRLSDCIGHAFAVPDNSMFLARIQQEMLTKAGIDARAVLKTNSTELIKDIVASGMAISIQTHSLLAKDLNRPNLKSIPLTGTCSIPHELACCIRAGRELPIAGSLFVDALKARLTQLGNESACEDEFK